MLFVKDSPRKNISTKPESKTFFEIITLLYKALSTSKSLVLTIIAGTLYHLVLGAAQFEVIWAVADKGFNPNTFGQINGWIFVVFGVLGSLFGGIASDWALKTYNLPRTWFLLILTVLLIPLAFTRYLETDNFLFFGLVFVPLHLVLGVFMVLYLQLFKSLFLHQLKVQL